MYNLAKSLVLKRVKEAVGLDQTVMFAFGAAPLK
jgi:long-subunit acyl-CoA synthetase (AMP-forming)